LIFGRTNIHTGALRLFLAWQRHRRVATSRYAASPTVTRNGSVWIGTCLNMDDQAVARVMVGPHSVEVYCASAQIEMDPDSLALLITTSEQALAQLVPDADESPIGATVDAAGDMVEGGGFKTSASSWVICNAEVEPWFMIVGEFFELHWGELVWTISAGALTRLLARLRLARDVLDENMDRVGEIPAEREITELVPVTG
jgi:hypothetical protein